MTENFLQTVNNTLVDITGQRFGHLTAVSKVAGQCGLWLFLCDCGGYSRRQRRELSECALPSCGCARPINKDITGLRFGLLTAVRRVRPDRGVWLFKCDCGGSCEKVKGNVLRARGTASCGCVPQKARPCVDIAGQRFGHLTAVSRVPSVGGQNTKWLFSCDCGNTCIRTRKNLQLATNPPSCGCAGVPNKRSKVDNQPWRAARVACSRRGLQFDLTCEQFAEIAAKDCHYCGHAPSTRKFRAPWMVRNGIDRVDNALGYVPENCVPCCKDCNYTKRDRSVTDFLAHVSAIHNHQTLCVPNIIHIKHHAPPLIHPNSLVHAGSVAPIRAAAAGS